MIEDEGANDSNLELVHHHVVIGLHPERSQDVTIRVGDVEGTIAQDLWALARSYLSDMWEYPSEATASLCAAIGAPAPDLSGDETDPTTEALLVLVGEHLGDVGLRWHWGAKGIDGKIALDSVKLRECVKLEPGAREKALAGWLGMPITPPIRRLASELARLLG
jgi:hypothetical protein